MHLDRKKNVFTGIFYSKISKFFVLFFISLESLKIFITQAYTQIRTTPMNKMNEKQKKTTKIFHIVIEVVVVVDVLARFNGAKPRTNKNTHTLNYASE